MASEYENFFTPDNNSNDFPLDSFSSRLLQFVGLQDLGYPVDLEIIPSRATAYATDEEQLERADEISRWEYEYYPNWVRPIVTNPGFARFIEMPYMYGLDIAIGGDELGSEEFDDERAVHPIKLAGLIDELNVPPISHITRALRTTGESELLQAPGRGLNLPAIAAKAFFGAVGRQTCLVDDGYPVAKSFATRLEDFVLYDELKEAGVSPIDPEQLGGLVDDYYRMVEERVPAFVAYKR